MDIGKAAVGDVDPKVKKKIEGYTVVLMKLLHSQDTSPQVLEMLQGDPFITVPQAANYINDSGVRFMQQAGLEVTPDVQFGASVYLIGDLIEIGNESGVFTEPVRDEQSIQAIMEDTYQEYIKKGLKNKTIDPIELQLSAEQFMTPEQRSVGDTIVQQGGVPQKPDQRAIVDQYAERKIAALQNKEA